MLVLVDPNDARAVRNKDTILAMYDLLINNKKSMEADLQEHPEVAAARQACGYRVQCAFHRG